MHQWISYSYRFNLLRGFWAYGIKSPMLVVIPSRIVMYAAVLHIHEPIRAMDIVVNKTFAQHSDACYLTAQAHIL